MKGLRYTRNMPFLKIIYFNFLIISMMVAFSGCSKYTMEYKENRVDKSMLKNIYPKSDEKILLLYDNSVMHIPCYDSSFCVKRKDFFTTGETVNEIAKLYFGQFYKHIDTWPYDQFDRLDNKFSIAIYPQVLEYSFTFEEINPFSRMVVLNMKLHVQILNSEKKTILDKNYSIDRAKSEPFSLRMDKLIHLRRIFYKSLFNVFEMIKEDMDKLPGQSNL